MIYEDFWYLARFWHQFGNSFYVGLMVMFLTLFVGSLASFTVGRMRLRNGWMLTNAALMTHLKSVAATLKRGGLYCIDIDRHDGVDLVRRRSLWRERRVTPRVRPRLPQRTGTCVRIWRSTLQPPR